MLYLLHGLGDEAGRWMNVGAANIILDNLIAQGKAKPMVMVTTLGYGVVQRPGGAMAAGTSPGTREPSDEVMPRSKGLQRQQEPRAARHRGPLDGRRGGHLRRPNHLDKFAWMGSFSGAYVMWPRRARRRSGRAGRRSRPAPPAAADVAAGLQIDAADPQKLPRPECQIQR